MQLLPRSLFGRLTLVLLTGLTTTMLLSASVHLRERGRIVHEAIQGDITERTVDTVLLLDSLPPAERHRLLPVLNGEQTRVGLADAPRELPPEDARTAGAELVGEQIRKRLGADTEIEVALAGFIMTWQDRVGTARAGMRWRAASSSRPNSRTAPGSGSSAGFRARSSSGRRKCC
ncbi:hypothetical protein [Thiorhodovibrio litoralis]|uniref:hypothetical protein n=1 Tax=Thiorhodovibrio litoralis TaxID=2952932 RepID=UPI002B256FCE|nr:hypothetical protein [Thiorhodovibrio litoralis]WPL12658.1 hypothetical protein Thiosp_02432 [Thiorhodovibrio litoralis]